VFLRTNLAAYRDRYTEIQKNVVLPGPVPVSLVQNVNDAVIKGVEFEATLIPFEGLNLGGTFAYTDAKFDRDVAFDPRSCDPAATALTGFCPFNRFNAVPKYQYSLLLDYEFPFDDSIGDFSVGGQLYHQSNVALTDTSRLNPTAIEPGYTTLNLRANWKNAMGTPIDLGAFVTNVTNEVYRIGNNNLLQRSSVGTQADIYAAPRMWGFSVKFDFGADGME
jgi:iron complex outermembrane receptor protein